MRTNLPLQGSVVQQAFLVKYMGCIFWNAILGRSHDVGRESGEMIVGSHRRGAKASCQCRRSSSGKEALFSFSSYLVFAFLSTKKPRSYTRIRGERHWAKSTSLRSPNPGAMSVITASYNGRAIVGHKLIVVPSLHIYAPPSFRCYQLLFIGLLFNTPAVQVRRSCSYKRFGKCGLIVSQIVPQTYGFCNWMHKNFKASGSRC